MRNSFRTIASLCATTLAAVLLASPAAAQQEKPQEKTKADRTVQLSEQNDSEVHGTAHVYETGGTAGESTPKHHVRLRLQGLERGEIYHVHLHGGTCEKGGQVITPLTRIEAGETGRGEDTATLPEEASAATKTEAGAAPNSTEAREHAALFLQARDSNGTAVACGDVPTNKETKKGGGKET